MKGIYWLGILGIASLQVFSVKPCFAQSSNIVPDNTLGDESSQVLENFQGLPVEVIRGGAQRGINLFHSFREFNISEGRGAYFSSPNAEIQNILTRVTGNNRSNILGTLGTFGSSQPNLFLINPNGIVFGRNASLDVRGSFVGSTADTIKFADGNFFSASSNQETPLLTISVPVGLQFGSNPGKITVRGNGHNLTYDPSTFATIRGDVPALQVQSGKTLAFVGGDIALEGGNLKAESGRIELGSVAEPGLVSLNQNNSGLTLGYSGIENFGDIQLSQKASVDASGERGGSIQVQSRGLSVKEGSSILSITSGAEPGGDFTVNATESVELLGESLDGNYASSLLTESQGAGTSGNLTINTGKLTTTNGAYVLNNTASSGNGGNLTVKAFDSVELSGRGIFGSGLYTGTSFGSSGNAGTLKVETGNLTVKNRATVFGSSAGLGNGGDVLIQASNRVFVSNATIISGARSASSGNIDINAGSVFLLDGARFQTSTQSSTGGNAGNVTVSAKDTVFLDFSDILSTVQAGGVSKGGNININAATFSLRDGAQIRTDTQPGGKGDAGNVNVKVTGEVDIAGVRNGFSSGIFSSVDTGIEGNGGNIIIDAGSFNLQDGAVIRASTFGQGDAGNVTITAKDDISLADNASIFSTVGAGGVGKGGNIDINGASLTIGDGAQLVTVTRGASNTQPPGRGDAGNVNVKVTGEVDIAGVRNGIFSRVETGTQGNGGNITIDAGFFKLRDGAQLTASTFGQGDAGNVTITAKDDISLADNASILSTVEPGGVGKGGNIDINAANLSIQNGTQLITATRGAFNTQPPGRGDAGNVNVLVTGEVDIAGVRNGLSSAIISNVETGTQGNGGNITIDAGSLNLRDNAKLQSSTFGQGDAGNVTITAKDGILFTGEQAAILSTVEAGGVGKGGNIDINGANLSIQDGAQLITATRGASNTQPPGRGDAGNVNVKVTGEVDIAGVKNGLSSGIFSRVETGTQGNGGNITIDAGSFKSRDGAKIQSSIFGQGNAGNVTITAKDDIFLTGEQTGILSTVAAGGVGKGGNIDINGANLSIQDGTQLTTSTSGQGDAGNVTITAKDNIFFAGEKTAIFSTVEPRGVGKGGNIDINAGSFKLQDGAQLTTSTFGQGDAGNVTVTAKDNIFFAGEKTAILSTVELGSVGKGGNIDINAASVSMQDGAQLTTSTSGQGNAGNVTVTVKDSISLSDNGILTTVEPGGMGKGGNIDINAASVFLRDGAQLVTVTRSASDTQPAGRGNAGNIRVKVTGEVDIAGEKNGFFSGIFSRVETGTEGNGGNITIDADSFKLGDWALLDARTENNNRGGNIRINTNVFEALNGGQLTTTTLSNGRAGNITVNATDKVIINGNNPNFNDRVANFPNRVANISANSGFFVSSTGSGITGDIEINSPKITLDNQGKLNANSASGNGGNINLTVSDLLLMRRGSQITTNAGTEQKSGDGGNIGINSKFIVAIPKENSDITANAFTGTGGNVEITSQGIFGIEPRTQQTDKSDITASSELGVPGNINLATPDNSSIQNSLEDLPDNQIDTNALIANSCIARSTKRQENSFTITGSGALRNSPGDGLISIYSTGDVRNVEPISRPWKKGDPIIEAQGLYRLPDGRLLLSRTC